MNNNKSKHKYDYATIVLFAYKRLGTLKKLIKSLKKNKPSKFSELIIFSDAYSSNEEKSKVLKVRKYLKKINGFRKIEINYRKRNFGLSSNIIDGVSKVLSKRKKIIVLEDDLILSKYFLDFMNICLLYYKDKKKIWHISGFNYNVKIFSKDSLYFTRVSNCWGWATWSDRWKFFKKNPDEIIRKWNYKKIYDFDFDGSFDFFSQIRRNKLKILNSWAVFWYSTIFSKKGLCINPIQSLTKNIGNINDATNMFSINEIYDSKINNINKKIVFPKKIKENKKIFNILKTNFLFLNKKSKFKNFLRSFFK